MLANSNKPRSCCDCHHRQAAWRVWGINARHAASSLSSFHNEWLWPLKVLNKFRSASMREESNSFHQVHKHDSMKPLWDALRCRVQRRNPTSTTGWRLFISLQGNFIRFCVTAWLRWGCLCIYGSKKRVLGSGRGDLPSEFLPNATYILTWQARCFKHPKTKTLERRVRWTFQSGSLPRRDFFPSQQQWNSDNARPEVKTSLVCTDKPRPQLSFPPTDEYGHIPVCKLFRWEVFRMDVPKCLHQPDYIPLRFNWRLIDTTSGRQWLKQHGWRHLGRKRSLRWSLMKSSKGSVAIKCTIDEGNGLETHRLILNRRPFHCSTVWNFANL